MGAPVVANQNPVAQQVKADSSKIKFPEEFKEGTPERILLENALKNNPEVAQVACNSREMKTSGTPLQQLRISAIGHDGSVLVSEESSANRPNDAIEKVNSKLDNKSDQIVARRATRSLAAQNEAPAMININFPPTTPEAVQIQNAMKNNPEVAQVVSWQRESFVELKGVKHHYIEPNFVAIGHNGHVLASAKSSINNPHDAINNLNSELDDKSKSVTGSRAEASLAAKEAQSQRATPAETNFQQGSSEYIQLQKCLMNNPNVAQVMVTTREVKSAVNGRETSYSEMTITAYDAKGKNIANVTGSANNPYQLVSDLDNKLDKR